MIGRCDESNAIKAEGEPQISQMTQIFQRELKGIEAFEKPILSSMRRRAHVIPERSEESAWHVMSSLRWKRPHTQGRSFAPLEDDGCFVAMNEAGEVFRRSHSEFRIPQSLSGSPNDFRLISRAGDDCLA